MLKRRHAMTLLLVPLLASCITTTRENDFPRATLIGVDSPPSIETAVTDFKAHLEGGKLVSSHAQGRLQLASMTRRWESRSVISSAEYQRGENWTGSADSHVVMSGRQQGRSSIALQIFSGLTLTMLPYYVDTTRDLEFRRQDSATGRVTVARAKTRDYKLVSLLFLPFALFTLAGDVRQANMLSDSVYCQLWRGRAASPPSLAPGAGSRSRQGSEAAGADLSLT